jgi:hypothetical protein
MKMGAKATVREPGAITPKIRFPVLMQGSAGSVVLFDSPTSGTCVAAAPDSLMRFGQYAANRDICKFKPFYGEVVLENE